ncbi:hypothetical protein ACVIG9_000659 [Bradyrhizobium ottawaense]
MPFAGFNVTDASFSKRNQMIVVRKLPARYAPIVMPFVLSILMTAVVSVSFDAPELGGDAGVPRDLAGRLGAVLAGRLSDAAGGAADGAADRDAPGRGPASTRSIEGAYDSAPSTPLVALSISST